MTELLSKPVVLLALGYLAASTLFQFRSFSTRLLGLDSFGILPRWKFFIPQKHRLELNLALRGGADGGAMSAWIPVRMFRARGAFDWIWAPHQFRGAILWQSAQRLGSKALRDPPTAGPDSVAYRTLALHLRQLAATHGFETFQFALIRRGIAIDPAETALFVSELHRL